MINISSNRSDNKCLITSQEVDNLQKSLNPSYLCIFTRNTGLRDYGVHRHFQQYFSYIVVVSYISGGNRIIRKKTPTYRRKLTNFII
jgi:hypothetical protein